MFNLMEEYRKYIRVLSVASRPRFSDFKRMAMVTAAGVIIMGILGLVISFILSI
jgi:protein translocase SEC61 complex gamma subunit